MEYIKGVNNRGNEVIALLESKGGKNAYSVSGEIENFIYYVDGYASNIIDCCHVKSSMGELLLKHGVELHLPKPSIFEGAKFGDLFKTRDGKLAVFLGICGAGAYDEYKYKYRVYVEGAYGCHFYKSDGIVHGGCRNLDIVSKV